MPELTLLEKIFVFLQHVVPQHWLSRLTGWLADSKIEPVKNFLIQQFVRQFDVDMEEAIEPDASAYVSFNDFFTRALKDGVRPIDESTDTLCIPADGVISESGQIEEDRLLQAKGHHYDLNTLLGGDAEWAQQFTNGSFSTIYLSPRDYHRVHMPCDGRLLCTRYIPGKLFSVNDVTAQSVPHLFARNERLVCFFESDRGPFAMILVGAMIVAGIETIWAGQVTPQTRATTLVNYDEDIILQKGEEMGRFKLGSTVILLFPENYIDGANLADKNPKGKAVKMGEFLCALENPPSETANFNQPE